jgi:glucose-6-phosphate isomerase
LHWAADTDLGARIHVLMPYTDRLREFAEWYRQLWAESLGKRVTREGKLENVGPTPVAAVGATDQHSQVQLFMEGPDDKTVTFLAVGNGAQDLPIPRLHGNHPDLAYLGGHSLDELLRVERLSTAGALAARGRMSMLLTLDQLDAWHLGGLIMLLEIGTAFAGELYGINAFDQPGVELGKRFTYGMFGRPGFEDDLVAWNQLPKSDPKYII